MKAEETVRKNMEEKKEKLAEEMKRREGRFKVVRKESEDKMQTNKERIEEEKRKRCRDMLCLKYDEFL